MKRTVALVLALSVLCFARVYGELDTAINQGNMLLADTLVNIVKVETDVYCPGNLDIDQAKLVYRNHLEKDPFVFLNSCDSLFVYKYVKESCLGESATDLLVCREWVDRHSSESALFAKELCTNQKTLDLCRGSLEGVPEENLMKYIQLLDKNGYLRYTDQEEYDTSYTAVFEKNGCMDKWNGSLATYKDEIYNKKNASGVNRFLGISVYSYYDNDRCDLSVSGVALKDSMAKCYRMVFDFVEQKKKSECYETKNVNEKRVRNIAVYPFKAAVARAKNYLMSYSWTKMNKEWLEKVEMVNRYEPLRYDFKGAFREGKSVPVDWAVASCLMNFGYNNQVSDSLYNLLPSCTELKDLYKPDCRNEGEEIERPVYLGDWSVQENYVCHNGAYSPNRR